MRSASRSSSSGTRRSRGDTPSGAPSVALGTLPFVLVFNFFLFRAAGDPMKDLIRGNPASARHASG